MSSKFPEAIPVSDISSVSVTEALLNIFSRMGYLESHLKHVETVLQRIKKGKLTIKPSKCKFAQQSVKFLGHIVGQGFRTPSEIKVQAVLEFPTSHTKNQILAFLGLAGYYQKYINLFSVIAAPLTEALKGRAKKGEITWTTECENTFRELKGKLIDKPSCTRQILNENSLFKRTLQTQAWDQF
ncbi:retrovirus-related Pol polyprotein from transposon 297 [Trichonephila clavipes]|nr:retrovirus-related Pol polyprotein from transposon 297 [Trichonephila clavipes]